MDPFEVQRQVTLAFTLEALVPKTGCTSRFSDVGAKQKFEYFAVSAINCGRYFNELAKRIIDTGGQPEVMYDCALAALKDSQQSRSGKVVNYGLLETMLPVVAARCIFESDGETTLEQVPVVLQATSKADVCCVSEMRKVVYSQSDKPFKQAFAHHTEGATVFEHYQHHQQVGTDVSKLFVREIMQGMPLAALMFNCLRQQGGSLAERINEGFDAARQVSALPAGAVADFCAVALYLAIADDPQRKFVD